MAASSELAAAGQDHRPQPHGLGQARGQPQGVIDVGQGLLPLLHLHVDGRPQQEHGEIGGVQLAGLVEVVQGGLVVGLQAMGPGHLQEGGDFLGVQLAGLFQGGHGVVVPFQVDQRHALGFPERRVFRIELRGRVEVGQGLVVVFLAEVEVAPRPQGGYVPRGDLDRPVEVLELVLLVVREAGADDQGLGLHVGLIGAAVDGLVQRRVGPLHVAAGQEVQLGHQQQGRRLVGVDRQALLEVLQGHAADLAPVGVQREMEDLPGVVGAALDAGGGQQLLGELRVAFVQPLLEGRFRQADHLAQVAPRVGVELGLGGMIEVLLTFVGRSGRIDAPQHRAEEKQHTEPRRE